MKSKKKEVLTWIKTQPELEHVRKLASQAEFIYDKDAEDPSQRLKIYNRPKYNIKKSFKKRLFEAMWVPRYKLRGNSYADRNFDTQLEQTSAIMSLSTVWDVICTSPFLFYFTKSEGVFKIENIYYSSQLDISHENKILVAPNFYFLIKKKRNNIN